MGSKVVNRKAQTIHAGTIRGETILGVTTPEDRMTMEGGGMTADQTFPKKGNG
jgi:hypothetical protein